MTRGIRYRGPRRGYQPCRPPAQCVVNVSIEDYIRICRIADQMGIESIRQVLEMLLKDLPRLAIAEIRTPIPDQDLVREQR